MSKEFSEINLSNSNGVEDSFMIHYDDMETATFEASTSNGIAKVTKVSENGNDQYTIQFRNGEEIMLPIANGEAFAKMNTQETKRYGVSGIGQQTAALTRLYDAEGMTAEVGTDDSSTTVVNDFDVAGPWLHRKCVGHWESEDDHAKFVVEAYYGDPAYKEDGTKGDYVAVELPVSYYQLTGSQLVISAFKYPGYRAFDIFCRNHDQNDIIEKVYVPAYALALDSNGHAVSLPDLDNEQGDYRNLFLNARKYNNDAVKNLGMMMPAAMEFYYWALAVVEFATQDVQTVMKGFVAGKASNNISGTSLGDTDHFLTGWDTAYVAGQRVSISDKSSATDVSRKATHKVLSITRCGQDGTPSDSGSYMLLEVEDLGMGYVTYDTTTTFYIAGRPYQTGACNSVVTPSGSPVSNSNGLHPMRYRYRENVWGNQFHTTVDLFNARIQDDTDVYHLDWYYLPDPSEIETPANPDLTALSNDPYEKLGVQTPTANYVDGYIKSVQYDEKYPDVYIPKETTGGSATTYFADYANLVSSTPVRSVRLGGYWIYTSSAGPSYFIANAAPASGSAFFGADLCFPQ